MLEVSSLSPDESPPKSGSPRARASSAAWRSQSASALLSASSPGPSSALQERLQQIVESEFSHERLRHVDDLESKVTALHHDKRKAISNLRATEEQYERLIDKTKDQVTTVRSQNETTKREVLRFESELSELRQQREMAPGRRGRLLQEAEQADSEVERLAELRSQQEADVDSTRVEIADLRQRLDRMQSQQWKTKEGSLHAEHEVKNLCDAVADASRKLEESERCRTVLLRKYAESSEQFQQAVASSEKQFGKVLKKRLDDVKHKQKEYNKHKLALEHIEGEIHAEDLTMRTRQTVFEDKLSELQRLHRSLEQERGMSLQREMQHLQCLDAQGPVGTSDAISLEMHQHLLEEQAQQFKKHIKNMENNLGLEVHVQELQLEHRQDRAVDATHGLAPQMDGARESTLTADAGWTPAPPSSVGTALAFCVEAARRTESRAEALQEELVSARHQRGKVEECIAQSSVQLRALSATLQQEGFHVTEVQELSEQVRVQEQAAKVDAERLRTDARACENELAERSSQLRKLKVGTADGERLSDELNERLWTVGQLEEERDALRRVQKGSELEISALESEQQAVFAQVEAAVHQEQSAAETAANAEESLRRRSGALRLAQDAVNVHVKDSRCRVSQLRESVGVQLRELQKRCAEHAEVFDSEMREQAGRTSLMILQADQASADAQRNVRHLEEVVGMAVAQNARSERDLEEARFEEETSCALQLKLQDAFDSQGRNIIRMLSVLSSTLPSTRAFDQAKALTFRHDHGVAADATDLVHALREGLTEVYKGAASAGTAAVLEQVEIEAEASAREESAASAASGAKLEAELESSMSQRADLAAQVQRLRRDLTVRKQACAAQSTSVAHEMQERESSLEEVRLRLSESEEAVEKFASELQTFMIESSLSLEFSLTDVAEPLKADLSDILEEVSGLQQRFEQDLNALDTKLKLRCQEEVSEHVQQTQYYKEQHSDAIGDLNRQMQAARFSETEALAEADTMVSELREGLVRRWKHLDEERAANLELKDEVEAAAQEETRAQLAVQTAEGRFADVQRQRLLAKEACCERRCQLTRSQQKEMAKLRDKKDAEIANLRSKLLQSFSDLSMVADDDDAPSVFSPISRSYLSRPASTGKNLFNSPPRAVDSASKPALRRSSSRSHLDST